MPLSTGMNNVLWITVRVGSLATPGARSSTLSLVVGATAYSIPVQLYVYDFAIPVSPTVQ